MKRIPILLSILLFLLSGCAQKEQTEAQIDYDQAKKMVVDILQTDEGKKAIQAVLQDEQVKQALILDEATVKQTIESTMLSEKGQEFWEQQFSDPKFAATFAKSMEKPQTNLMKTLMKDPDFQSGVISIMKNPEIQKQMQDVMQSKDYRQYLQQVLNDTVQSPLFQVKMIDVISKAIEKAEKKAQSSSAKGGQEKDSQSQ
ncbi:spore germination lipoprotein GerD [Bacillus sp. 165]|uniref:spore germination lipoprotein GerD n=1 Tax=Bacillus sp. 165 TaxID=1529117 RepID=UPI001ADB84B6|nr:spore germination lipoprotein GerD [Bacillus sp. 165]MBO9131131.1 spore gernimation protein GerD [Bacillus sp. 165]